MSWMVNGSHHLPGIPLKTLTLRRHHRQPTRIITVLPGIVDGLRMPIRPAAITGGHITGGPEGLKLPEVIVGMDGLTKLHVYFAQGERKLYITDAGAPAKPQ